MNSKIFKTALMGMIQLKGLEVSESYVDDLWGLIKNDFTDEEFQYACAQIIKNDSLYNKQPDPQLFYKYRNRPTEHDIMLSAKNNFLERVANYISEGFTSPDVEKSLKNPTPLESRCLQSMGGLSELCRSVRCNNPRSVSSIIKDMGRFFEDMYRTDVTLIDYNTCSGGLKRIGK